MPSESASTLIAQALKLRDDSIAAVTPPLGKLPQPLPKNVTGIAKTVLTPEEIKITEFDAPELIELMKRKELSCETVTKAFLRRAALAQELVSHMMNYNVSK